MGWNFRKSKKIGPFRVSLSKTGIGFSGGVKGLRFGVSPNGRAYRSISVFGFNKRDRLGRNYSTGRGAGGGIPACLVVVLLLVFGPIFICCGGLLALQTLVEPAKRSGRVVMDSTPGHINAPTASAVVSPSTSVDEAVELPDPINMNGESTEAVPSSTEESWANIAALLEPQSVVKPVIEYKPIRWNDDTGGFSVVASLLSLDFQTVTLKRADNQAVIKVPLERLSQQSVVDAWLAGESRVDPDREILLGKVSAVIGGNLLQIRTIGEKVKTIRLEGIDVPKRGQSFFELTKGYLEEIVLGEEIRVEIAEQGEDHVVVGKVYVRNLDVSRRLIYEGLALHDKRLSSDEAYVVLERFAMIDRKGIWGDAKSRESWNTLDAPRP